MVLYYCVKQMKKLEKHKNFWSDIHKNLTSTKLYQDATEYKISSISEPKFLRYSVKKFWRHTYKQTDFLKCSNRVQGISKNANLLKTENPKISSISA